MKMHNIPIFVPHLGCPHQCAFCNQHSITGAADDIDVNRARAIIEENLKTLRGGRAMVAFFGGSFTGIDEVRQCEFLALAKEYLDRGDICGIRLSTRPDYIDEAVIERLLFYGVTNVELGAQSMRDSVLCAARRGHDSSAVRAAAQLINSSGITLGLQMMTGLLGDDDEGALYTAREFVKLGAKETRIYPTLVVEGTYLCEKYRRGEYKPQSVEEAVDVAARLYEIFLAADTVVLRIGLLGSESLKASLVAGPYHDAIREMVYSRVIRRAAQRAYEADGYIKINCPARLLSKTLGQKRCNALYFHERNIPFEVLITDGDLRINQSITMQF